MHRYESAGCNIRKSMSTNTDLYANHYFNAIGFTIVKYLFHYSIAWSDFHVLDLWDNCEVSSGNKSLPEVMLTYHQRPLTLMFIWIHKISLPTSCFKILTVENHSHINQCQRVWDYHRNWSLGQSLLSNHAGVDTRFPTTEPEKMPNSKYQFTPPFHKK